MKRASLAGLLLLLGATEIGAAGALYYGRGAHRVADAPGEVVAIAGDVVVTGDVRGDVIAWGGSVRLEADARVAGSILLVGSSYEAANGSRVGGRVLQWADLAEVARSLALEGGGIAAEVVRWRWGLRLGALAIWLVMVLLVAVAARGTIEKTARRLSRSPLRSFLAGATLFCAGLFVAWLALALPYGIGSAALALIVAAGVLGKVIGVAGVALVVGRQLGRVVGREVALASPTAVTWGLLVLGAVRWLPGLGAPLWTAASLIGFGAVAGLLISPERDTVTVP